MLYHSKHGTHSAQLTITAAVVYWMLLAADDAVGLQTIIIHRFRCNSALQLLCLLSPSPSTPCAEEMATEQPVGPTQEQLEILEYNFSKVNKHPDPTTLCLIAAEAGLTEEQTLKWFKQRLAEWRKSEGLPSECGSVRD
ncbi:homeodomain-only protein isoform X2 [Gopherus flavomarginatus]|nr:homeodomain-only protein isoform X2 [Gopherus flavomarginatus]